MQRIFYFSSCSFAVFLTRLLREGNREDVKWRRQHSTECFEINDTYLFGRELQITGILDKIDEYRRNWFLYLQRILCYPQRIPQNRIRLKIIPLQTTRKENIWQTEEALERAAVTLETERMKGSNPWCLWWWRIKNFHEFQKNNAKEPKNCEVLGYHQGYCILCSCTTRPNYFQIYSMNDILCKNPNQADIPKQSEFQ